MSTDARQMLRTFVVRLLLGGCMLAGIALTWGAAGVGLTLASPRTCRRDLSTAKLRVKVASDAAYQYMIETASCPSDVGALVAGKYLDKANAKDPRGSELILRCPRISSSDNEGADVFSPGPDREPGTADDIKSWEL